MPVEDHKILHKGVNKQTAGDNIFFWDYANHNEFVIGPIFFFFCYLESNKLALSGVSYADSTAA